MTNTRKKPHRINRTCKQLLKKLHIKTIRKDLGKNNPSNISGRKAQHNATLHKEHYK